MVSVSWCDCGADPCAEADGGRSTFNGLLKGAEDVRGFAIMLESAVYRERP